MELLVRRQKLVNHMICRRETLIISISHLLQTHCMQTLLFLTTQATHPLTDAVLVSIMERLRDKGQEE